jgi:hypothetical protein
VDGKRRFSRASMPKRSAIIRAGTNRASKTTGPPERWSACAADGAASQDGAEWRSAHVVQVAQSRVAMQASDNTQDPAM